MEYDILIIGSRVAGASLALLLGQRGYRILMVDRDHFPGNPLSTNLILPATRDTLRGTPAAG